jgi:hypothetical protein
MINRGLTLVRGSVLVKSSHGRFALNTQPSNNSVRCDLERSLSASLVALDDGEEQDGPITGRVGNEAEGR